MWKDSPLDSSGFKDVDGDVEMMIAPKAYPLSSKNRKRNHDEDEILVRVLIDSITYVLKWMSDRKEIAIPMISRFPVLKNLYAVRFV